MSLFVDGVAAHCHPPSSPTAEVKPPSSNIVLLFANASLFIDVFKSVVALVTTVMYILPWFMDHTDYAS